MDLFDLPYVSDAHAEVAEVGERAAAIDAVHQATAIYTTMSVVEGILDRLDWPGCGGRLLDPSAGDGAFLTAAIRRVSPEPGDIDALSRVHGYEFHPEAVADARARVSRTLVDLGWQWRAATDAAVTVVERRDFLTEGGHDSYARIAANPPYLRFARLPDYFKALYPTVVAKYAIGDLLHAFIDRCCEILDENGSIGLISSDRWLGNESAKELRRQVGLRVSLAHIERLDVTTSFYRPKVRRAGSLPRIHPVAVVLRRGTGADLHPVTDAPISPEGTCIDAWDGPTLADMAQIRLAPWLGPHGIFTVDLAKARQLGAAADLVPVVDTDDVNPTTNELGAPTRMAIRTRRDVEPTGAVARHLLAMNERMPARGRRGPYWMPPEKLHGALDEPALMVPRIAQRIRVIDLPAGVSPINHNLTVFRRQEGGPSLDEIRAVLTSPTADAWLHQHAQRLENGYLSITTSLLRRLPFRI